MAEFSKKIHMVNSAGQSQSALIYSTTGESGVPNMPLIVDGMQGYACLVTETDIRATHGRAKLSNGSYYAIGSMGVPDYAYGYYGSNGSFTVPVGVTKLRVTCVGGGAGALAYPGSPDHNEVAQLGSMFKAGTHTLRSGGGGTTNFGSVSAGGADGNSIVLNVVYHSQWEDAYYTVKWTGGTVGGGGVRGGHYQSFGYHSGTSGMELTNIKGQRIGTAGKGGGGGGDGGNNTVFTITGSSGHKTVMTVSVYPGQVIPYSIGGGGSNYNLWSYTSENGSPGAILVEWGKGVQ